MHCPCHDLDDMRLTVSFSACSGAKQSCSLLVLGGKEDVVVFSSQPRGSRLCLRRKKVPLNVEKKIQRVRTHFPANDAKNRTRKTLKSPHMLAEKALRLRTFSLKSAHGYPPDDGAQDIDGVMRHPDFRESHIPRRTIGRFTSCPRFRRQVEQ